MSGLPINRRDVEDCRDASVTLHALTQAADVLYEGVETETSPAAEGLAALLAVVVQTANQLARDLDAALMGRGAA